MDKEVVVSFFGLLVKWAKAAIFPTPSSQSIRRPKPILQRKPRMVFNFWRRPSFLNKVVQRRLDKAEELQLVCGCRGVLTIGRELSKEIIILPAEMHILDEGPKKYKLGKVLHRYCSLRRSLVDPFVVMQSFCDGPIFPFAKVINFWDNILGHAPVKPWRMPKRSLSTISKHDMGGGVEDLHVFFGARVAGARSYFVIVFPLKPRPTQKESHREFAQM
jgi:hypothetical protein